MHVYSGYHRFGGREVCHSFGLFPLSTAPGPVQSLSVTFILESATYNTELRTFDISVNISWQLPLFPNGEIITYGYRLVETSNSSNEIITDTNTTDLGMSVVRNVTVSPFTNYTATVVAYTSAGRGETATVVTTSPEAGIRTDD